MHVGHLAGSQLIVNVQFRRRVTVHQILLPMGLTQIANRSDRHATAFEGLPEGGPEIPVEVGVDERIQRAVKVTHPKHRCNHRIAAFAAVAQRRDDVPVDKRTNE